MVIFYNPYFYICCPMLMELTLFSLTTFKRLSRQGVEPRYLACKVNPLPTKQGAVREIQKEMEKKDILSERKRGLKRKIGRNSERQRNCQVPQLSMVFSQEATVCSMLVFNIKQYLLFFRKQRNKVLFNFLSGNQFLLCERKSKKQRQKLCF